MTALFSAVVLLAAPDPSASIVEIRYGDPAKCDCTGTGFFIQTTGAERLFVTARHVWYPLDSADFTAEQCGQRERYVAYRSGGNMVKRKLEVAPRWESRQEDLVFVALPVDAPPPDGRLRVSSAFPHNCEWQAWTDGLPQARCARAVLKPLAQPFTQEYVAAPDGPTTLHTEGEARQMFALIDPYPEPGHSGAPVVIPGTDVVTGVVLHRGEELTAVNATAFANLLVQAGSDLESPLTTLNVTMAQPVDPACAPPSAAVLRPLDVGQRPRFREIVRLVFLGLLDSFRCEVMSYGTQLANYACEGGPCSREELLLNVYPKTMNELLKEPRLCTEMQRAVTEVSLSDKSLDLKCDRLKPWLNRYGDLSVYDLLGPPIDQIHFPGAAQRAAKAYAAEAALIQEILFNRILRQQGHEEDVIALISRWTSFDRATAGKSFHDAGVAWSRLSAECPDCQMPLAGLTGRTPWSRLLLELVREWVAAMQRLPESASLPAALYAGCSGTWMRRYEGDLWKVTTTACPGCLGFRRSINADVIADRLTSQLLPDSTSPPTAPAPSTGHGP